MARTDRDRPSAACARDRPQLHNLKGFMSQENILTIVIPTYNRAATLSFLLTVLRTELAGLASRVSVIIGDNASPDDTAQVTAAFERDVPGTRVLRHAQNLGADENFCSCLDVVTTRYFWIIGDDDMPKPGVIARLVALLVRDEPDLVYLHSEWSSVISHADQGVAVADLHARQLSRLAFAREVNVWVTFISGLIIRRAAFHPLPDATATRRFAGTNLVQLSWVLGALQSGVKFVHVSDPCILATAGNTGGYAVVNVFSTNFTAIVNEVFGTGSAVARAFIQRNLVGYLPQLVWDVRFGSIGTFHAEGVWATLKTALSGYAYCWLFLAPISLAPKEVAWVFLQLTKVFRRVTGLTDKVRRSLAPQIGPRRP